MINLLRDSFNHFYYSKQFTVEFLEQITTGSGLLMYNATVLKTGKAVSHAAGVCLCMAQDILCNIPLKGAIETTIQMLCTSSEGVFFDRCSKNVVEEYVFTIPCVLPTALAIGALVVGGLIQVAPRYAINHDRSTEAAPAA